MKEPPRKDNKAMPSTIRVGSQGTATLEMASTTSTLFAEGEGERNMGGRGLGGRQERGEAERKEKEREMNKERAWEKLPEQLPLWNHRHLVL